MPLYVYKSVEEFQDSLEDTVQQTLQPGSLWLAGHRLRRYHDTVRLYSRLRALHGTSVC